MTRPWSVIESVATPDGPLELRQRGPRDFLITLAGRVVMNSVAHRSEQALAELGCRHLGAVARARVLIGGLGMGMTLRAALDALRDDCDVVVAELNPEIVRWCRGPLAPLSQAALEDPRVQVEQGDVAKTIAQAASAADEARFDAILLDLYEGPVEAGRRAANPHFGVSALSQTRAALRPGGVFSVWSEEREAEFEKRLAAAGFSVEHARAGRGGRRHVVYLAQPALRSSGPRREGRAGPAPRRSGERRGAGPR